MQSISHSASLLAAALLATTTEASFRMGSCPQFKTEPDFDLSRYTGLWYEVVKDKLNFYELLGGCTMAEYSSNDDGSVAVHNIGHKFWKGWFDIYGTAVEDDTEDPAALRVDFFKEPVASDPANYYVIATDYDNYTVVYNCEEKLGGMVAYETFGILARDYKIDDETLLGVIEKVEDRIPGYEYFKKTKMTRQGLTCPYKKAPFTL